MEEGKERKLLNALGTENKSYPCVWYKELTCPIRTQWKLSPENLAPWCTVCKDIGYLEEQKKKLSKGE